MIRRPDPTPGTSPPAVPRPIHRTPLLGVGATALFLSAAGCSLDAPAGPAAAIAPADVPAAAIAGTALPISPLAIVQAGLDDVITRILPSLSATRTAVELRKPLYDLAVQLAAGDGPRARRALVRAREAGQHQSSQP